MNQEPFHAETPASAPAPKPHPPTPGGPLSQAFSSLLLFLIVPIGIALFLTAFIIQSYQVDGQSMETTLHDHDRLIVSKLPRTWSRLTHKQYTPNRGDIIIFNQSGLPDIYSQKQLIKRVVGLPGERVVVSNGSITVYNASHPNGFNPDTQDGYRIAATNTIGDVEVTLQPDEIFVCGDNRDNSEDSRYFGPVNLDKVVGKLVVRILPMSDTKVF